MLENYLGSQEFAWLAGFVMGMVFLTLVAWLLDLADRRKKREKALIRLALESREANKELKEKLAELVSNLQTVEPTESSPDAPTPD